MSYDNKSGYLIVGDSKGTVRILNVNGMQIYDEDKHYSQYCTLVGRFRAHCDYVTSVGYIPMKSYVLTSSKDMSIRLWELDGKYIGTFGQEVKWNIYDPETYTELPGDIKQENERDSERLMEMRIQRNSVQLNNVFNVWSGNGRIQYSYLRA
jgi:WD40 repeat protein